MWFVFILMFIALFITLLAAVWIANKVMIKIHKDNDKYEKEKKDNEEQDNEHDK